VTSIIFSGCHKDFLPSRRIATLCARTHVASKNAGGDLRGSAPEPPGIYRIKPPAERNPTRMSHRATTVAQDRAPLGSDPSAAAVPYGTGGVRSSAARNFPWPNAGGPMR